MKGGDAEAGVALSIHQSAKNCFPQNRSEQVHQCHDDASSRLDVWNNEHQETWTNLTKNQIETLAGRRKTNCTGEDIVSKLSVWF